jgi:hypothetical protein
MRRAAAAVMGIIAIVAVGLGTYELVKTNGGNRAETTASTPGPHTVRSGLGSRSRPVPIRVAASIGDGWRLTILSVDPDVSANALGQAAKPPAGRKTVAVTVAVEHTNPGTGNTRRVVEAMTVVGDSGVSHRPLPGCLDQDAFANPGVPVVSGTSASGSVCFQVGEGTGRNLELFVAVLGKPATATSSRVWYALGT